MLPDDQQHGSEEKWFIKSSQDSGDQIDKTLVYPHTNNLQYHDGLFCSYSNNVQYLIDGKEIMGFVTSQLKTMIAERQRENAPVCQVWIANFVINNVWALGEGQDTPPLLELLEEAANAGVEICLLISAQGGFKNASLPFLRALEKLQSDNIHFIWDQRYVFWGAAAHHQKFCIMQIGDHWSAVVGSADMSVNRWDDSSHASISVWRPHENPTHELAVLIEGVAVLDLAQSFVERWNDDTHSNENWNYHKHALDLPAIDLGAHPGTCSIQVLRTYPINPKDGFAWSDEGEFGVWRAYRNAIRKAEKFIYIEDQYFLDAGFGTAKSTGLIEALGDALMRGVSVIVIVAEKSEDAVSIFQSTARNDGVAFLDSIAQPGTDTGRFTICYLESEGKVTFVHSKVMIVDGEVSFVGSANFCRRSMTFDSELQVCIVDVAFAESLLRALLTEHLEMLEFGVQNVPIGVLLEEVHDRVREGSLGRLRNYMDKIVDERSFFDALIKFVNDAGVDPYGGPPDFNALQGRNEQGLAISASVGP